MSIKNYFSVLGIEPEADITEIKKAYRKLAHQFHPDKNMETAQQFAEIKEAYEVLTNSSKRQKYLRQWWQHFQSESRHKTEILTCDEALKRILLLEKYVSGTDVYRFDTAGMKNYILAILNENTLNSLRNPEEQRLSEAICFSLMRILRPLPYPFNADLIDLLKHLAQGNETLTKSVEKFARENKSNTLREKMLPWILFFLTLLICIFIWIFSL
ncbi:MAG: J domain-containing protein [Chitinophagaceae bacterium]|nr:J domain-containing protein [Chitinophagaceae bacterium]